MDPASPDAQTCFAVAGDSGPLHVSACNLDADPHTSSLASDTRFDFCFSLIS